MTNKKVAASLAVVCFIIGFMLSLQFRTTSVSPSNYGAYRVPELTARLEGTTKERDILAEEVVSLREQLAKRGTMDEETTKLALAAGQLPGEGPGIQVVLDDSTANLNAANANDYLVHDSDLQYLVNELKSAGAEAIAINGERLTATSEIRCAGTMILVNSDRVAPPYIIDCVGDPKKLEASLSIRGGWLATMRAFNLRVDITPSQRIVVPASKAPVSFDFLKPIAKKQ